MASEERGMNRCWSIDAGEDRDANGYVDVWYLIEREEK